MSFKKACLITSSIAMMLPYTASGAEIEPSDLLNLSLAELSNISITSVSKTPEKENEAAAAIYVITQEDIRRSGATAIPDLLRMAPGITVTKSAAADWTVTARGFNDQFSNKLLVLIDGRTIYSPLFSGVIWNMHDLILEDIDRIEVIRGPGATLWGANAVNGVINIITKNARHTQGGLLTATAGNQIDGIGSVRYGTKLAEESYIRTYAKYTNYDSEFRPGGADANDEWNKAQAGFRTDSRVSDTSKLTVQGDIFFIDENAEYIFPDLGAAPFYVSTSEGAKARGGNVLARWEESLNPDSLISLQAYYDNAYRKTFFFNDETHTVDLDFQHTWTAWESQEIVWGAGYRFIHNVNDPISQQYSLMPQSRSDHLFNAFLQDKFTLVPEELFLTLGSKFEHNNYTGVEIQPSARVSWLVADNQTIWGAVSRAVHTPSRFTDDGNLSLGIQPPGALPILFANAGNRNLDSEVLLAYELGYRIQPTDDISLDIATFYNDYSKLFIGAFGAPVNMGTYIYQPIIAQNANEARSMGIELSAEWNITRQWQMAGSYSYLNLNFENKGGAGATFVGKQPRHMFNARSTYLFQTGLEMTNALYYVDDLTGVGIPGYYRFDTQFSYPLTENIEVSLVGQNLLNAHHREFTAFFYKTQAEIGRSVYGNIAFRF